MSIRPDALLLSYTLETARSFLETLCPAEVVQALIDALFPLGFMRLFRDQSMAGDQGGTAL